LLSFGACQAGVAGKGRATGTGGRLSHRKALPVSGFCGSDSAGAAIAETPAVLGWKCESGERRVSVVELAAFGKVCREPVDYFLT
jgi:hypothetical protein